MTSLLLLQLNYFARVAHDALVRIGLRGTTKRAPAPTLPVAYVPQ